MSWRHSDELVVLVEGNGEAVDVVGDDGEEGRKWREGMKGKLKIDEAKAGHRRIQFPKANSVFVKDTRVV